MIISLIILIGIILGYIYLLMGRKNHPQLDKLRGWKYAHRGLHDAAKPENSMAAFRAALEKGYGIELDVHLMKDGNLAVIHDASLMRVAGADVKIEDLTIEDLPNYHLGNSQEQIPLFKDVLALYNGKAPMVVELKCERGNHAALCRAVLELLDTYQGDFCVESFDPRAIHWLKVNRPDICRGQLTENWFQSKVKLHWALKFALTFHISNFYTRPDFLAVRYCHRKTFGTDICRKILGVQGVSWTLKNQEEYNVAISDGWIPIFEDFEP